MAARLGLGHRASPEVHHVTDQLLHLGLGAVLGIAYTLSNRRPRRSVASRGALFGIIAWGVGAGAAVPLLRAARPPWTARASENLVNIAAHLIFGLTTALVADEMSTQRSHGPSPDAHRFLHRIG